MPRKNTPPENPPKITSMVKAFLEIHPFRVNDDFQVWPRSSAKHVIKIKMLQPVESFRRTLELLPSNQHGSMRSLVAGWDKTLHVSLLGVLSTRHHFKKNVIDHWLSAVQDGFFKSCQKLVNARNRFEVASFLPLVGCDSPNHYSTIRIGKARQGSGELKLVPLVKLPA